VKRALQERVGARAVERGGVCLDLSKCIAAQCRSGAEAAAEAEDRPGQIVTAHLLGRRFRCERRRRMNRRVEERLGDLLHQRTDLLPTPIAPSDIPALVQTAMTTTASLQ
jgi:hypothetical protein